MRLLTTLHLPSPLSAEQVSLQGETTLLSFEERRLGNRRKVQPSCLRVVTVCCWFLGD